MPHARPPPEQGEDPRYRLKTLTRCRAGQLRLCCGSELRVPTLRVAECLCKTGAARPADFVTRLEVDLMLALQDALPR